MVKNTRTQTSIGTSHQPLNMPTPITVRTGTRQEPAAASVPKRRVTAGAATMASGGQRARGASGAASRRRGRRSHPQHNAAELVNVAHVIDMWEIEDEWWRKQPVRRRYWHVTLETGQDLTVFQDLQTGEWYQQDY